MIKRKLNYIICTPAYGKSNGVRALYTLGEHLLENGFSVSIFSHAPYQEGFQYIDIITDEMRANDIIIYPEVVKGNPLQFRNVVRYVLYFPGKIGGTKTYHHSEQIFTWHEQYYSNVPTLAFPFVDTKIFYKNNSPKLHNSYFVHKGGKFRDLPETDDAIRIDMLFPESREELGELLRATDTLYSYDSNTAILNEASACGAKVKIITQDTIIDFKDDANEYTTHTKEEIKDFINITQSMNYQGVIEAFHTPFIKKMYYKFKLTLAHLLNNSKTIYKYRLKL